MQSDCGKMQVIRITYRRQFHYRIGRIMWSLKATHTRTHARTHARTHTHTSIQDLECHAHTGHSSIHRQEAAFQRRSTHPWMYTSTGTGIPWLQQEQVPLPISTLGPSHCWDSLHGDLIVPCPVVLADSLQTLNSKHNKHNTQSKAGEQYTLLHVYYYCRIIKEVVCTWMACKNGQL